MNESDVSFEKKREESDLQYSILIILKLKWKKIEHTTQH